ncbi:type II secretion system protein [Planctomycetota bacterium]
MRKNAFTLVELLVVIGIITALLAMVFPVSLYIKQCAQTTVCQAHIRQLVMALVQYDHENNHFPYGFYKESQAPPGAFAGDESLDRRGWRWFNYLGYSSPNIFNPQPLLECPSKRLDSQVYQDNVLWGNYGVNWSICKGRNKSQGSPLGSAAIRQPAETMLLMDAGFALIGWYHAAADPPEVLKNFWGEDLSYVPGLSINTTRTLNRAIALDAINGRHPNKTVNVAFIDGHLEQQSAEKLRVDKTEDGYRNVSPRWSPRRSAAGEGL